MRRAALVLTTIASMLVAARPAAAQAGFPAAPFVGRPVASLVLRVEGRPTQDRALLDLVETPVGQPLSMDRVRATMRHLFELGRFEGVEVHAEGAPDGGVALVYELRPLHAVSELTFRGETGLSGDELRRVVVDRYTKAPPPGRADAAARTLEQYLSRHGFLRARVTPALEVRHDPDRTVLAFTVQAGPRARVGEVRITGVSDASRLGERFGLRRGATFDFERLDQRVADYAQSLRRSGYYEATVDHKAEPRGNGALVDVSVDVNRGPAVRLAFEGDPLPKNRLADLVPVEREGTVDEDLLEDSDVRARDYLLEQGYAKAQVAHRREQRDGAQIITFTVRRGPRYLVKGVEISGNATIPIERLRGLVTMKSGEPFVERKLTATTAAIRGAYARQGFGSAAVEAANSETLPARPGEDGGVAVRIVIREGTVTRVGTIAIEGNAALPSERLRGAMKVRPGDPFFEAGVAADKESVLLEYLNEGFSNATVAVETRPTADRRVDLTYRIVENARVIVDHIIVVGNTKTSEETIRRELLLEAGQPLGYDDLAESQRRLSALGLFRRVRITEVPHGDDPRRDIIVTVEEANRTTLSYGGGAEITPLTVAGAGGIAEQQYDIAPRGSFEIGRRNLWGKNRSVNLFTRLSLRSRGRAVEGAPANYGLNEYRVVGTYRELGAFGSRADVASNAFIEQAVRSSFNFRRQGLNAEMLRRVTPFTRLALRYTIGRTELLDAETIPLELQLDVDRAFPQVRLSTVSTALYRDTRDNPLEPSRGTLVAEDTELALRSIGSQVGFGKIFLQGFLFRTVSPSRGVVFAGAARLGLARAFAREVGGTPVGADLPASERFFAGGSTTVRGFALDRLGTDETISGCPDPDEAADPAVPCTATGFPLGGSGMLVLNAELRVPVWQDIGLVGFMDAGNVFARASDLDLTELRFSPGLGLRYRSPIGPIRVDVGFKLKRRELSPGRFEAPTIFHISVGHAF